MTSQVPAARESVPHSVRIINLLAVTLPLIGVIVGVVSLWGSGFNSTYLGLLLGMYFLTGLGITVGFHRLFTHRSFETTAWLKAAFLILGSMAMEGPLLRWVAQHRLHHQHSDKPADPHSPHHHVTGPISMLRGLWHSHIGWIFDPDASDLYRYVGDLRKDGLIRTISALFPLWACLGLAIPAILGGLFTQTWMGALLGFVWGGLARIFLVHHITWSINSVCHLWGKRPFDSDDQSRNNVIFGLLGFG